MLAVAVIGQTNDGVTSKRCFFECSVSELLVVWSVICLKVILDRFHLESYRIDVADWCWKANRSGHTRFFNIQDNSIPGNAKHVKIITLIQTCYSSHALQTCRISL